MNITNSYVSTTPCSSFELNNNCREFNEDNAKQRLDTIGYTNENFSSMIIIDNQQNETTNEIKSSFHRKSSF